MFYTPIQLSEHQAKTPEGFLVCYGCAIARTGVQLYHGSEVPKCPAGEDGMVRVERSEAEVFAPEVLLSGEGKDIVIHHPEEDVMPHNWRDLTHGHMQNLRRGTGAENHLLLADLVFKSPESIAIVENNPRTQLSCGYDARYQVHGPGHAKQTEIRINHIAADVVARCGPTCSTRDAAPHIDLWGKTCSKNSCTLDSCDGQCDHGTQRSGDAAMASWLQRIQDAFRTKDETAFNAAVKDAETSMTTAQVTTVRDSEHHIHVHLGGHGQAEHGPEHKETTKPAGDLPETGEQRVTSAKDEKLGSGGEQSATFGGHTFFSDDATNRMFHDHMRSVDNAIMGCHGEMAKMKDTLGRIEEHLKAKDSVTGEEPAHEKANKEIEGELKEEVPPGTGDINKSKDSAFLGDSFAQTCRDAEILVPGISVPTFDSAVPAVDGYKTLCGVRRKALLAFSATADGEKIVTEVTKVRDFAGCSCRDVTAAFRATVAVAKAKNSDPNIRGFKDGEGHKVVTDPNSMVASPFTLADWQAQIDKYHATAAE